MLVCMSVLSAVVSLKYPHNSFTVEFVCEIQSELNDVCFDGWIMGSVGKQVC
jgi:hypothetical protein